MDQQTSLTAREKSELKTTGERTRCGHCYQPDTDIHETAKDLVVVMDMPGVTREGLDINIEKGVLKVEGHVDPEAFAGFDPVYTEYNVGDYARSFSLSHEIDQESIRAEIADGVLTLTLPKKPQSLPRRIAVH